MKIVVLDGYTENPGDLSWDALKELGELAVYDRSSNSEALERMKGAEAVYTNKTVITREMLENTPGIKFIGVLATGYNVVDVEAAADMGIVVCNIPSYGTDTVAQYTMALLLELCHHVGEHSDSVKNGEWSSSKDFCYWKHPMMELAGKTFGIIGYGKIGQRTAEIAAAFKLNILTVSRSKIEGKNLGNHVKQVELEELLAQSDIISLHCPLTDENKGFINKASIEKMKDGVLLINTARGALIQEEDLREALVSGKVAGAALDVVCVEPIKENNVLLKAPNIIITPHIAWAAKEARERLMETAVNNLKAFLQGNAQNVVNNR